VNSIVFAQDCLGFTVSAGDPSGTYVANLTISGAGVTNYSKYLEPVQASPTLATNGAVNTIFLTNSATLTTGGLGDPWLRAMGGTAPGFVGGQIQFLDSSTAGAQYSYAYVNAEAGQNGGDG